MRMASDIAQCITESAAMWCRVYFQNTVRWKVSTAVTKLSSDLHADAVACTCPRRDIIYMYNNKYILKREFRKSV